MRIDEAIKINQYIVRSRFAELTQSEVDAITLGIEALKRLKELHKIGFEDRYTKLPGETEEPRAKSQAPIADDKSDEIYRP